MVSDFQPLMDRSKNAGENYAPTSFWQEGARQLIADFEANGLENFRQAGSPLMFFVPTYGFPGNALSKAQLNSLAAAMDGASPKQQAHVGAWLSGEAHALADYRAFVAGARTSAPELLNFSESNAGNPCEHFTFAGRQYSRSALNYLHAMIFLAQHTDTSELKTFLEIGGGFGTLGEILAKTRTADAFRYINVDIPPTCFASDYYLAEACKDTAILRCADAANAADLPIDQMAALAVLPNWQIEALQGSIDVFVNMISFQEMEPHVVSNYLKHVERLAPKWIILRNMREGKQKRTDKNPMGVVDPVLGEFYQAELPRYRLVAKDDQVFGYTTADGFHSDLMLLRWEN